MPEPDASLAIQGPGGYGKSAILREPRRQDEGWHTVDDAHLLPPQSLARLRQSLQRKEIRLALAFRPWPRPQGLAELVDAIRRDSSPIVLTPLSEAQTADCLNATLAAEAAPLSVVRFAHAHSGGIPLYAERMAKAIDRHGFSVRCQHRPCCSSRPYKQIGDQLFISAKTVEHQVARMRQRLSCGSRSELLARLRTLATAAPRQRGG